MMKLELISEKPKGRKHVSPNCVKASRLETDTEDNTVIPHIKFHAVLRHYDATDMICPNMGHDVMLERNGWPWQTVSWNL
jgi:hypothetical protein